MWHLAGSGLSAVHTKSPRAVYPRWGNRLQKLSQKAVCDAVARMGNPSTWKAWAG